MSSNFIIKTTNLILGYHNHKINETAIDLNISKNKMIAVLGNNGSGKSTLLKTLGKHQTPISGKVFLGSNDLNTIDYKELATQISWVTSKLQISEQLSVFDFVALGRQPYTNWLDQLSVNDIKIINEVIKLCGIDFIKEKKVSQLSDGQLQLVQIARAITQDTPVILLDEPTSHLDITNKVKVFKILKKLTKNHNKTIIFSSHEVDLCLQLCDEAICIDNKKISHNTIQKLIESNTIAKLFDSDILKFNSLQKRFEIK